MNQENNIILKATNLHKTYTLGRTKQHVLRGVNMQVRQGEFIAIMGASGSGKSTLLHILGLLDRPDRGEVFFDGRDVFRQSSARQNRMRSRDIGFVFQFYHLLPELTLEENVILPMMVDCPIWAWPGRRLRACQQARHLIADVGLEGKTIYKQRPATLSGGQLQRGALARALIQKPRLLLADEPTGNLDSAAGNAILDLLESLNRHGQTVVMVTHDPNIAARAHRKLVLRDGKIS